MTDTGQSPPAATPAPGKRSFSDAPRWVRLLLIASLAANVLVVGMVAGAAWRWRGAMAQSPSLGANLFHYTGTLPRERRAELHKIFLSHRDALRPLREEVHKARLDVDAVLAAPAFDRAAFLAATEKVMAAETRVRQASAQVAAEVAAALTPQERQGFAGWRVRHRPKGPGDGPKPRQP